MRRVHASGIIEETHKHRLTSFASLICNAHCVHPVDLYALQGAKKSNFRFFSASA